jgi:thioredoxin-like negative regulator of GroEL
MQAVTGRELPQVLQHHEGPVIAMFYARWCRFCRQFEPVFDRFAAQESSPFLRVDVSDESDPAWEEYHVAVVPTLIAFLNGHVVARRDGLLGLGLTDAELAGLLADVHRISGQGPSQTRAAPT